MVLLNGAFRVFHSVSSYFFTCTVLYCTVYLKDFVIVIIQYLVNILTVVIYRFSYSLMCKYKAYIHWWFITSDSQMMLSNNEIFIELSSCLAVVKITQTICCWIRFTDLKGVMKSRSRCDSLLLIYRINRLN